MGYVPILSVAFILSLVLSGGILQAVLQYTYKHKLFDYIDGRKVHTVQVPRLGGMAFVPAIVITMGVVALYAVYSGQTAFFAGEGLELVLCVFALGIIYAEGVADDTMGLGYKAKFACQFFCAAIVVFSGIYIDNLHGFLGIGQINTAIGMLLSGVLIVFIINAINLIDGIDGLASGLSMLGSIVFCYYFYQVGLYPYATLALVAFGTVLPFFLCNVFGSVEKQQKIFMGDCGSQTVGLLLGIFVVRIASCSLPAETGVPDTLALAFALLLVPSLDVIRVMIGRMARGYNPFHPDKTHIHHKLLALGMGHRAATTTILLLAIAYFLLTLFLCDTGGLTVSILGGICTWIVMHGLLNVWMRHHGAGDYFKRS